MTSQLLKKIGKKTALASFTGGSLILLLYYFTANDNFIFGGLFYIIVAGLVNLVLLIIILTKALKSKPRETGLFYAAGILLLNIPAALLMLWFGGLLLNTMRITITNPTTQDISEVIIEGCEKKVINLLKAGESTTVWIKIPGECAILMSYTQGTIQKREVVIGYLSRHSGGKATHTIGQGIIRD